MADLRSNLLYDLRFNEFQLGISGTTANSINIDSNGGSASLINNAVGTPSGYLGQGIYCRGINNDDHISLGYVAALNFQPSVSVIAKVKFLSFRNYDAIFSHYRDTNKRFEIQLGGGSVGTNSGINVYCGTTNSVGFNSNAYMTNVFLLNTWYTIGAVFSGAGITNNDKVKIYLNGNNLTGITFPGSITGINSFPDILSNQNTTLCMRNTTAFDANIIIDTVKIFTRSLTAEEMFLLHEEQDTNNFSINII